MHERSKMNEAEIYNRNRLIVEFMGKVLNDTRYPKTPYYMHDDGTFFSYIENLPYNTKWEWLMPVVENIELLGYDSYIACYKKEIHSCLFQRSNNGEDICYVKSHSKIEAVFITCSDFIIYYNREKV